MLKLVQQLGVWPICLKFILIEYAYAETVSINSIPQILL